MAHAAVSSSNELTHYRLEEASKDQDKKKEGKKESFKRERIEQEVQKAQHL